MRSIEQRALFLSILISLETVQYEQSHGSEAFPAGHRVYFAHSKAAATLLYSLVMGGQLILDKKECR